MPCYTRVEVTIDDTAINRRARSNLGLRIDGTLSVEDARRVKVEAGVLSAMEQAKRLAPTARIIRKGNEVQVSVQV